MQRTALRTVLATVLLVVALAVVGCGAPASSSAPVHEPTTKVVVTRKDASLPNGCAPRQVAGLVTTFFQAFNEGKQSELSRFFVAEGPTGPGLFGSHGGGGLASYATTSRDDLLAYFAGRHEHEERMRLLEVDVGRRDPSSVDIAFDLTRTADDIGPRVGGPKNVAFGKGTIDCQQQRFVVWNMAMASTKTLTKNGTPRSGPCPGPSGRKPGGAVVACARKGS